MVLTRRLVEVKSFVEIYQNASMTNFKFGTRKNLNFTNDFPYFNLFLDFHWILINNNNRKNIGFFSNSDRKDGKLRSMSIQLKINKNENMKNSNFHIKKNDLATFHQDHENRIKFQFQMHFFCSHIQLD